MTPGSEADPRPRPRDLFLRALDLAGPARDAFLDDACRGDARLREEVSSLLGEHDRVGDFLEVPAFSAGGSSTASETLPMATGGVIDKSGDHIDRYKLLQKIGEGGGGSVYMAEQEYPVRRRVALKVIKAGMDTKGVIARFEAERQALAMMDHPNIARVLDAGATETGRPYFVMELVRGVRITEYCDENKLSTEQRLELFIRVCHAIQHAHQKGIIHRDIKPSNILVTLHDGAPVPKVIDFGIAKATETALTDKTVFTEFQSFIGTPAYMSPEQAQMSGLDIDTRSDIYALGVLMYELLTGHPPFDPAELTKSGIDECRRTIREQDPKRPSTRVSDMAAPDATQTAELRRTNASHLVHSLKGDLDWIVMKCLEKERGRRYPTTGELAADVQRYLDGDAILARPPSNIYRVQKFFRKHKVVMTAAAAVTVALLGGIGFSTWQAIRATKAEHDAHKSQVEEARLRVNAERETRRAEQESTAARLNEYVADINLAQQSVMSGGSMPSGSANLGRALQLLHKHRPLASSPDLRGFEWRYLWQLTRGDDHIALPNQESAIYSVAFSPCGNFVAVGLGDRFNVWRLGTMTLVASHKRSGTTGFTFGPPGSGSGVSVAFLPQGLLVSSDFGALKVWSTNDWAEQRSFDRTLGPLVVSANGMRLAVRSFDAVRLWDTVTWQEQGRIRGAEAPFALSSDGTRLAASSRAGLSIWNVGTSNSPVVLADSTNLFARAFSRNDRAIAFSHDGKHVFAGRNVPSERGVFVLGIWDAMTGEDVGAMPADPEHIEHTGAITCIALSPDGKSIASAGMDHTIRLWDTEKRQRTGTLLGHVNEVWAIAFSSDGKSIVSGAKAGGLKVWPTQPEKNDEVMPGARLPLAVSRDGKTLAALNQIGNVVFLDVTTGEQHGEELVLSASRPQEPPPRNEPPQSGPRNRRNPPMRRDVLFRGGAQTSGISLSSDLSIVAAAVDRGIRVWNRSTEENYRLTTNAQPGTSIALSPDGTTLVSSGWGSYAWWDLQQRTNVVTEGDANRMLFSPSGRLLAVFDRKNTVELRNVKSRTVRATIVVDPAPMYGASSPPGAFSPDEKLLAIPCQDDAVRLWDTDTATLIGTLTGHKQAVYTVAFAPDGKTLASGSDDSTLKFWNVASQQELLTLRRLGGAPRGLIFSPDGAALFAGSSSTLPSGSLRVFRAPSLEQIDASEAAAGLEASSVDKRN